MPPGSRRCKWETARSGREPVQRDLLPHGQGGGVGPLAGPWADGPRAKQHPTAWGSPAARPSATRLRDQVADAGLGHDGSFLLHQPLPNPASGMTLPPRCGKVLDQPPADRGLIRGKHRRGPSRWLPHRWHGVRERLTNHAAVHLVLVCERPDRQVFIAGIASDTFQLLHSRSHFHPYIFRVRLGIGQTDTKSRGTGRSRVGPLQSQHHGSKCGHVRLAHSGCT